MAPNRSRFLVEALTGCIVGISDAAAMPARIPTGRLMMKIHRHEYSARTPPRAGPTAAAIADVVAQILTAPARFCGGRTVNIRPRLLGVSIAAPAACNTRQSMSDHIAPESAQPTLAFLEQYGFIILMALLYMGVIGAIMRPVSSLIFYLLSL